nr:MAG TPA: hypothetical protein [Caudoviricetes sp.]
MHGTGKVKTPTAGIEPEGSFPRIRQVAPIVVAAIFYTLFEEVNAYQKAEKV